MRGLQYLRRVFEGRYQFRSSLPLLAHVRNVSWVNPDLDPACTGGGGGGPGFTPWMTRQGAVDAPTHGGADASLLAHQLDGSQALA